MLSFWWNFHHWLHWKLSKRQLPMQSVMKISSRWRHFRFSVDNSDNGAMCAGRITTSLFVSCRSHCYIFACYYYFMLRLFILCYSCRTIALVATAICWLYQTLNESYLFFSFFSFSFPFFSFLLFIMIRIKSYIRNTFEIVSVGPLYKRHRILLRILLSPTYSLRFANRIEYIARFYLICAS